MPLLRFCRSFLPRLCALAILPLLGAVATANSIAIDTAFGATVGGSAVDAEADITTGNNTVTVTLKNLLVEPQIRRPESQRPSISPLMEPSAPTASPPASGVLRTISSGVYTDGATVATGWVESSSGNTLKLDVLSGPGHAGPKHTIVGAPAADNKYDDANSSINGNGPHNPFLSPVATFTFSVMGVTAATDVTSATFQFGTTDGTPYQLTVIPAIPTGSGAPHPAVPLPAALGSALPLLAGLGFAARFRKKLAARAV